MPVFRIDGRLIYFAHVPKCAGTSVETYLRARFGVLGLLDTNHAIKAPQQRWSQTSPQHVDTANLRQLIPLSFFDAMFTVVRHPVDRLASVFRFQRDVENRLPPSISFSTWLDEIELRRRYDPYYLDNHARLMTDLVPGAATVFRLEDGMKAVVDWLDTQAGNSDGPRMIPLENNYLNRLNYYEIEVPPLPEITYDDHARIADLYAPDYDRFGYDPAAPETGMAR